jgi:hypothetical protein
MYLIPSNFEPFGLNIFSNRFTYRHVFQQLTLSLVLVLAGVGRFPIDFE